LPGIIRNSDTSWADAGGAGICGELHERVAAMTILWFVVWLIWNLVGDREPLEFAPVNFWAGALLLCVALDLGRQHAEGGRPGR
jgi:hypothetical protein